ncbi:MAG: hypothetical protein HZA03_03305 [Nitrospinae bacterium]|nr:hypothetical protein [Nitrospinota bacterium]
MTKNEIEEFTKALAVDSPYKLSTKEDILRTIHVRNIQLSEWNSDCFRRYRNCTNEFCAWFKECMTAPES